MQHLDWTKLLGFSQIVEERDQVRAGKGGEAHSSKVGAKVGVKT